MIYQVGKKQCSISGRKQNDIAPLEVILWSNPPPFWNFLGLWPPNPPGISNSLRGGGLDIFWNHTLSFYYIQQYVYIQIPNKYNTEPTFALLT